MLRNTPYTFVLLAVTTALLWPLASPPLDRLQQAVWLFLHFPAMALVAMVVVGLQRATTWKVMLRTTGIMALLVPSMELCQTLTGRSPSWSDLLMGWAGALAGLTLLYAIRGTHRIGRLGGAAVAILLLLGASVPVTGVLLDRWMAKRAFPLLASFRTPLETARWTASGSVLERSGEHAALGDYALAVTLRKDEEYPGLFMTDFPSDWSEAEALQLHIYVPGTNNLTGWIRVDDKPFPDYSDRFQETLVLRSGHNAIRLDLRDTFVTPRGRQMRKEAIHTWGIFFDHRSAGRVFHMDAVYLTGIAEQ